MWKDANWWYLQHKFNRNVCPASTVFPAYQDQFHGVTKWCAKRKMRQTQMSLSSNLFQEWKKNQNFIHLSRQKVLVHNIWRRTNHQHSEQKREQMTGFSPGLSILGPFCGRISYLYSNSFLSSSEIVQKWHENKKHRMHPL